MGLSPGFAGHAGLKLIDAQWLVRRKGAATWTALDDEAPDEASHVHLWLHAAQSAAHEFHTGRPGSFAVAVARIDRARALGIAVSVSSLLTRSNAAVLGELPAWLHARGIRAWRIAVPRVSGAVRRVAGPSQVASVGALDGLLPRLGAALPHALQALARAAGRGLPAGIGGAPHCLLGPFVSVTLPEPPRAYAPVCERCPARARCPGVDAGYLRRFAGDELSPRGLRAGDAGMTAPSDWLFPGTGSLEQVATDMSEAPARQLRLPVLPGGQGGR